MDDIRRRSLIAAAAGKMSGGIVGSASAQDPSAAVRDAKVADVLGPKNPQREIEELNTIRPSTTDYGTMPKLKWSFAGSHMRIEEGGWARWTTTRELPISKAMAGVNMRRKAGAVREMHWHKEAEWAYMFKGKARITAIDQDGRTFADDVGEGDLCYLPGGIPHSMMNRSGAPAPVVSSN